MLQAAMTIRLAGVLRYLAVLFDQLSTILK